MAENDPNQPDKTNPPAQPAAPDQPGAAGIFAPMGVDPSLPERRGGRLTRKGMEDVIRGGGSVLHNGVFLNRLEQLPSEAELSIGNDQAEQDARKALEERQAQLDREKALLDKRLASQAKQQQQQPKR